MLDSALAFLNTPLGAAVLLGLGIAAPKLPGGVGAAVTFVLQLLKSRTPSPAPTPSPTPAVPPTGRPLLDAILDKLRGAAAKRFPTMPLSEAVERILVEQLHTTYYHAELYPPPEAGRPVRDGDVPL